MHLSTRFSALTAALLLTATAGLARAEGLRLLSADARGLTLQVSAGDWSLSSPDPYGRVRVVGVPSAHSLGEPGRAVMPAWSAMLAVPGDAHPSVRVVTEAPEQVRDGVKLAIAGRPGFKPDPVHGDATPVMEDVPASLDGAWPLERARLGALTQFRGRTLISIEVRPFSYDERASRLRATPTLTVRVDFNRPGGARALPAVALEPDPGMDAALASSVLNFEQARPWRIAPGAASAAGSLFARPGTQPAGGFPFDESQPEVRVNIDSTGLWQLPFDQLAPVGYPAGVPIAEVSLHRHEFRENSTPSYTTVDVPIEVEDANNNGVFDSGDRIWFYLRSWAARSGASQYQRWWGDGDVVFATRKPLGGLRMTTRPGWRNQVLVNTPVSYPSTRHYELNGAIVMPFVGLPTDTSVDVYHWTPYAFYYDRPDTILFDANDIDTSRTVQFKVSWVGRKFSSHFEWAAVRNNRGQVTSVADSVFWANKTPYTAVASIRGSALSEGRTNSLRIWGKSLTGPPALGSNDFDAAGLNWFETTYYRRYNAVHDVLEMNSGDATGEVQITAGQFLSDSIRIYDVTDPERPERLILDRTHFTSTSVAGFTFQDSVAVGAPHAYVAAAIQQPADPAYGPKTPPPAAFNTVSRRDLFAKTSGDYLLIVPEQFLQVVQPLDDLRKSQGLHVVLAPTEAIYDEFNGGRHSAAALQRFVKYAYDHWSTRFALLLGDGSLDPQMFSDRSGRDLVPVLPTPGPVTVGEGYEIIPSDNRYGCLTGNCDPIVSFGDVIPEIMIGRLPANTLAEAQAMVDKVVAYENLAGDNTWRRHLLLSSDDAFSGDSFFGGGPGSGGSGYCHKDYEEHFVGLNTKIASIVTRDAGLSQMNAELFNLRYYLANEPFVYSPPADTCRPDRSATQSRTHAIVTPILFGKLNSGVLWWNYQGHANEYVLTHENLYINSGDTPSGDDRFLFANDGKPFLFSAFSCHANMFARATAAPGSVLGGCLGEDMMALPNKGAIASWASVCYEVVPRDDSTHINVELGRALFASPPQDEFVPGDRGARVVMGEAIQAAFLRYLPTVASYSYERGLAITYTLLGDPAQRISIGQPQTVVYANDVPVTDRVAVRLHTPGDTLTLVADLVSTVRLDSLGLYENDGAGDVAIPASAYSVSPAFPDTAGGGVYGGRRFRVVYGTRTRARSYHYTFRTIDRNGLRTDFVVQFQLDGRLRVNGAPINDGDNVSPRADLSMVVLSPKPLNPASDLVLMINGAQQSFTPSPVPGDASGREWILSWTHADYPKGNYLVNLTVLGDTTISRRFTVTTLNGELRVDDLFAFPNPFDNDGTNFSFVLASSDNADVKITVFTVSGRQLYTNVVRGLTPGYHQIAWDGRDAEGTALANGTYFYRLNASGIGGAHVQQLGRLVKIRKPRHVDISATP